MGATLLTRGAYSKAFPLNGISHLSYLKPPSYPVPPKNPIQRIEIERVEATAVVELGVGSGHFRQQVCFRVGHQQPETLLEVMDLRPRPMRCGPGAEGAPLAGRESVWRFFGKVAVRKKGQ